MEVAHRQRMCPLLEMKIFLAHGGLGPHRDSWTSRRLPWWTLLKEGEAEDEISPSLYFLTALRISRGVRSGSEDDDVGGRKDYLIRNQSASQSAIDNASSLSRTSIILSATGIKEAF